MPLTLLKKDHNSRAMSGAVAPVSDPTANSSSHNSLKFFLGFRQFLGVFPVSGVTSSQNHLKFQWISWSMLHTIYVIGSQIYCLIFAYFVYDIVILKTTYGSTTNFLVIVNIFVSIVLFVRLASHWPDLVEKWCKIDLRFNSNYESPKSLTLRLNFVAFFYLAIVAGEYALALVLSFDQNSDLVGKEFFQKILEMTASYNTLQLTVLVVTAIPVATSLLIIAMNDLIIILVSILLATRFEQIVKKLEQFKNKNRSIKFWIEIRKDYCDLGNLCRETNDKIANIVLVSFAFNIYLLLVELYNIISFPLGCPNFLYSSLALAVQVVKLCTVYHYASWLNEESRKPVRLLFSVSSNIYNIEIRRWLMQMELDSIALTGYNLFKVTRGLILSIGGAVVSYELIFIQLMQTKN